MWRSDSRRSWGEMKRGKVCVGAGDDEVWAGRAETDRLSVAEEKGKERKSE